MREELLDWSQSKIFYVYYYFRINNVFIADKGIGLITKRHDVLDTSNTITETKVFCRLCCVADIQCDVVQYMATVRAYSLHSIYLTARNAMLLW